MQEDAEGEFSLMFKLGLIDISDTSLYSELEAMEDLLCDEKYRRIRNFRFQADRIRSMCGEYLLRYMLWREYGIPKEEVAFSYGVYRKPELKNQQNLFFNISHSVNRVICGLGTSPIGVDVEFMNPGHTDIARSFYSEDEKRLLEEFEEKDRCRYFYKIWTLKESYLKLLGCGLMAPLNSCSVSETYDGWRIFNSEGRAEDICLWNFEDHEYQFSVCKKQNCSVADPEIEMVPLSEIITWQFMYRKK